MSLPTILRQIVKQAQHPNILLHKVQLAKAKRVYLKEDGTKLSLGDGRGGEVLELDAPTSETARESQAGDDMYGETNAKSDDSGIKAIPGKAVADDCGNGLDRRRIFESSDGGANAWETRS